MQRPLLIIAISYLIGIIIEVYLQISIPFIIILVIINICSFFIEKYKKYIGLLSIITITIIISVLRVSFLENKYDTLYKDVIDKEVKAVGIITSSIKETEYRYSVTVKILSIDGKTKYKNTKINLSLKKSDNDNLLEFGNKIFFTGTFSEGETRRNYKGFNYKEYLRSQEIYGSIDVTSLKVIEKNQINIISSSIKKLSNSLKRNLKELLPQRTSGLMIGILIGDVSDISDEVSKNFKDCNLSHMLAVSGSHISYIMIGLNLVLNKKIFGIRNCKIITIFVIIIFMMLTNMTPSVVRAGICSIIVILASLIHRKQDTYTSIAFAILYTLVQNPYSLYNIGMQLSYAGTISIIIFYQEIKIKKKEKTIIDKIKNYILDSILLTLSANILIIPLTIYNFNTISLNFVLANLLAGPIMAITTILGLFISIISLIVFPLSKILIIPLNFLLETLLLITEKVSKIPFSNITVITPHILVIILMYLTIFACFYLYKHKEKITKTIKLIGVVTIIIVILDFVGISFPTNNLKIHFIDVGQGDSTLICTPSGKKILIDGGGSRDENYDVGESTLLPYLLDRRVNKIDYVIISHFDADHAQGLEAILESIKVKYVIISKQASPSSQYEEIIDICNKKKIKIIVVKRGDKIEIDNYTFFEIFHPGEKMLDDGKGGLNANAIVAKLYYKLNNKKYFTVLFTGDIEMDAEAELVKEFGDKLKSDILKVAHHGSKTSSTANFLEKVKPKIALIGVGANNTFGHPNDGVLNRISDLRYKNL